MNYQELADATGLKYSTARRCALLLMEEGAIKKIDETAILLVKNVSSLTDQGFTLKEAVTTITLEKEVPVENNDEIVIRLRMLEEKLGKLNEENANLREDLRMQETEIKELKDKLSLKPLKTTALVVRKDTKSLFRNTVEKTVDFFGWLFSIERADKLKIPQKLEEIEDYGTETIDLREDQPDLKN